MATIYLVTAGEYSDYHIIGAFSTKERAEAAVAIAGGNAGVEEWEIDDPLHERPEVMRLYEVAMMRSGKVESAALCEWRAFPSAMIYAYSDGSRFRTWIWARDREHAIKIANERRTAAILNGELK